MLKRYWVTVALTATVGMAGAIESAGAVEVGSAQPLSRAALHRQMAGNSELAQFVVRHGMPDWAEAQRVATDPPLTNYEVRVFYLDEGIVVAFTKARLLEDLEISLRLWQRPLNLVEREFVKAQVLDANPVLRAQDAASRAEAAADRVEAAAETAELAADMASSLLAQMDARVAGGGSR